MKTVADILAAGFARALFWWLETAPQAAAELTARGFVRILRAVMPRLDRVADRNLELAFPEKSTDERRKIREDSYRVLAQNLLSFARSRTLNKESSAGLVEGEQDFRKLLDSAKGEGTTGVLIATMHFGCFELALQLITLRWHPISALVREFGLPRLDAFWTARREHFGSRLFGRKGGYRETLRRLELGQDVAILCDQNVKANHAIFVDFFGLKTSATRTTALAVLHTGAPLVLAAFYELSPGRYKVIGRRISGLDQGIPDRDEMLHELTQRLHSGIEEIVRAKPEQWFWIHRRWKTRPEGEPETMYNGV